MKLARRNLFQEKTRLFLSVAGVALAVMLVLVLNGFTAGLNRQLSAYLDHSPGTVIVSGAGIRNMLGATSVLPSGAFEAARSVNGVAGVVPIVSQYAVLDLEGRKQFVYLIGYDAATGGGPWRMKEGREPAADDEIVFDSVLAARRGVRLGDPIDLVGHRFTVVGLSEGTTSWMTSYIFLTRSAADSLLGAPGMTSFLLVSGRPGTTPEQLKQNLSVLPGTQTLLKSEVVQNDRRLMAGVFTVPLQLMALIASLVGALVVGFVIYTATAERQREYGVLKAIGARNGFLYRVVAVQALVSASLGAVLGIALAEVAARLIMVARPQILVSVEPSSMIVALLAGLVMAVLAALAPARLLARLAPAEVFRR